MSNTTPSTRMGRIAVFKMSGGRVVTNLSTPTMYEHVEGTPEFSHWGTDEFIIDLIPPPKEKDVA